MFNDFSETPSVHHLHNKPVCYQINQWISFKWVCFDFFNGITPELSTERTFSSLLPGHTSCLLSPSPICAEQSKCRGGDGCGVSECHLRLHHRLLHVPAAHHDQKPGLQMDHCCQHGLLHHLLLRKPLPRMVTDTPAFSYYVISYLTNTDPSPKCLPPVLLIWVTTCDPTCGQHRTEANQPHCSDAPYVWSYFFLYLALSSNCKRKSC